MRDRSRLPPIRCDKCYRRKKKYCPCRDSNRGPKQTIYRVAIQQGSCYLSHTLYDFCIYFQIKNVNIFDEALMAEEFQGKDVIVSCLGASGSFLNRTPVTIYTETAKVFTSAMRKSGVNRLVVMAAWYVEGNYMHDNVSFVHGQALIAIPYTGTHRIFLFCFSCLLS